MSASRLARLRQAVVQQKLSAIAIMPGPNLAYLSSLQFHLSERPTLLLVPAQGQPALICPTLEAGKTQRSPTGLQVFTYNDGQDPREAFQAACRALQLNRTRVGIEAYKLRVLELRLLEEAGLVTCEPADQLIASLRMVKDTAEIAAMRRAVQITEAALDEVRGAVRVGQTEKQVAAALVMALLRRGAEGLAFEPLVQSGANAALPHATASDRMLRTGEVLLLDFGVTVDGYQSDITRTFMLGKPSAALTRIYEVVQQANAAGRAAARPGATGQDVDHAARQVIEAAGYGQYFTHRTGHGLGMEGHEPPYIVEGNTLPLAAGNTITIEPGIYIPGLGGVRIEDDLLITENDAESLTTYDRDMRSIG